MKALSIRHPWAWAIVNAGKRVENRDWRHAPSYRGPLLIHASAGGSMASWAEDFKSVEDMARRAGTAPPGPVTLRTLKAQAGGIVGRANLVDMAWTTPGGHRHRASMTCMLCGRRIDAPTCPKADPWAIPGTLGLLLADVVTLPFVPLKGMLGLFDVDERILRGAS